MTNELFRGWVEAHKERAYWAAFRILRDHEDALDTLQEACCRLYRNQAEIDSASVGAWLTRVAAHAALDVVRRRQVERRALSERHRRDGLQSRDATPTGGALEREEERKQVVGMISELPDRQGQVVWLRMHGDLTFGDIGKQLEISEASAKTHYRRGIQALRRALAGSDAVEERP